MSKKILAIVLAACMMLSLVALMSGCNKIDKKSVQNNPNAQVLTSIEKTKAAFKKGNSGSPLAWLAAAAEKGAITFETQTDEIGKISNTLYMDKAENKYADKLLITKGEEKIEFDLYANKEALVVSAPDFLGEGAYGIDLKNIYNDLKDSGIWETIGISFEDFKKLFGSILQDVQAENNGQQTASMRKMLEMWNQIKTVTNQCKVTVDEQSIITINDMAESVNITYTLTTDQLKQIVDIVMEWVGSNSDLMDLISFGTEEGETPDESEPAGETEIEKITAGIKKTLDDSRTTIKVTFSINPKTETLMKVTAELNANVDEHDESFHISLDLGKDVETSSAYKFRVAMTNGADKAESVFAVNYKRMDAKGIYDRRITVLTEGGEDDAEYTMGFAWVMSDMSYTMNIDWDGNHIAAGGFCKIENDTMEVTLTSLKYEEEDIDINFRLLIAPGKEVPETPKYTNILKMSEKELKALIGNLIPEEPDIPDLPDASDIPDMPDIPDTPDVPEAPDVPDVIEEPTIPPDAIDEPGISIDPVV